MSLKSCLILLAVVAVAIAANNRPIIGILSQPSDGPLTQYGSQYIDAAYVKWVESGGGRAAPIIYTQSVDELTALFYGLNGILLPGGGASLEGQYYESLQLLWKLAIQANLNGDYFPVWGTCQGFEQLAVLQSQNVSILIQGLNSENYTVALDFTSAAATSRLFQNASADIMDILGSQPVTMNNHQEGCTPETYQQTPLLNHFFDVLSTNVDRNGTEFISTWEAKDMPIYGTQWHPEKPLFEWDPYEVINHSEDSIRANYYTAQFFLSEARSSAHAFPSTEDETAALIYNYSPVFVYPLVFEFEQCYFFNGTAMEQ